jgi:DNA modification methylase
MGDPEEVMALALPPSVAGLIVCSTKIEDADKEKLLSEAIKDKLNTPQVRIKIKKLSGEEEENPIFRTNLWRMAVAEPKFGSIFPGRLPGQIVYNVLHHYSEIGDLCLFPFVGSGTEADVALYMGRDYYAWDIHHVDSVEEKHGDRYFTANSLAPWQITKTIEEKADLVFADPPRFMWGNGTWEDSDSNAKYDIGTQDLDEFMQSIELVARNAFMSLKVGGKFVILLRQPGYVDIPNEDITFSLMERFSEKFELVKRIAVSFPTTSYKPEKKGEFASDFMDLLVLEKR